MVQAADVVAYNVLRQFRDHGAAWEDPSGELTVYPWLHRLLPKFRQGHDRRIQGFGIVKIPLRHRVMWQAPEG